MTLVRPRRQSLVHRDSEWAPGTFTLLLLSALSLLCVRQPDPDAAIRIEIERVLSGEGGGTAHGDSILAGLFLRKLYAPRTYAPAWILAGKVLPAADSLLGALRGAEEEGLDPDDYHRRALASALLEARQPSDADHAASPASLAALDLLLSDACALYATHLAYGKVDPHSSRVRWSPPDGDSLLVQRLPAILGAADAGLALRSFAPTHPAYARLRQALALLRASPEEAREELFRETLLYSSGRHLAPTMIRGFQRRHGIDPTGALDSLTRVALEVTVEERLHQILCNLDRWRQLPHDLGRVHVRVNIPDFRLTVIDEDREPISMKIVAGLPAWPTPILSADMTMIILNPHWLSTHRIFAKELANYVRADSHYLTSNRMTVVRDSSGTLVQVDPASIPWETVEPESLDFQLLQEPGPDNIVGRLKFLMPNRHNIFLHDTPYREDFTKRLRLASHGCIRLESAAELALYALRGMNGWTRGKVDSMLESGIERRVNLKTPLPVHVIYCTIWLDPSGRTHCREDVYGLDARMREALSSPPPGRGR